MTTLTPPPQHPAESRRVTVPPRPPSPPPRPRVPPATWPDRHPIVFVEIMPAALTYAAGSTGIGLGFTADRIALLVVGLLLMAAIPSYAFYARRRRHTPPGRSNA